MRFGLVFLFLALPLFSTELRVLKEVHYTDAGNRLQSLDVYSPSDGIGRPVIIWIHGGGWKKGDKAVLQQKPQAFVEKGYVLVSINYRLLPEVGLKEMMGDIAKAFRWVRDHAAEHRGNPDSIVVMGHSAGAHLAALICTDERYLKAEGVPLNALKGCVPVDVSAYDVPKRLRDGGSVPSMTILEVFGTTEAQQREFSPIYHIASGKGIPPFLILHVASREDTKAQAHWLKEKLAEVGVKARVLAAEGKTHTTISTDLGGADDPPTLKLWKFLDEVAPVATAKK